MKCRALPAAVVLSAIACAQNLSDFATPAPLPAGATLIVGFLGGFERWDDGHRGVRKLALALRQRPGVFAETAENRRRRVALRFILRALQGVPEPRVILYGQSWGAAAAIATARDLNQHGIPVLLTVQVDSVGVHDAVIPPNVAAAVNFYQRDPLTIQGRREIRAADPARTRILGNFAVTYTGRAETDARDASWVRRKFGGSHARMELDPAIWAQVEQYMIDAISR